MTDRAKELWIYNKFVFTVQGEHQCVSLFAFKVISWPELKQTGNGDWAPLMDLSLNGRKASVGYAKRCDKFQQQWIKEPKIESDMFIIQ